MSSQKLTLHGGSVVHSHRVHIVFWAPAGSNTFTFDATYTSLVTRFFTDVAHDSGLASNVYQSDTQYYDSTGNVAYSSTFAGAITATNSYPSSGCVPKQGTVCLTDAQIQHELTSVIQANQLPTGMGDIYFLFTPSGVDSCFDASVQNAQCSYNTYCAYHSNYLLASSQVLYANMTFPDPVGCNTGQHPNGNADADNAISIASHEHNETITDPLGSGWYLDDPNQPENGDMCSWDFGTALGTDTNGQFNQAINGDHYYIQREWSNADSGCVLTEPHAAPLPQLGYTPQLPTPAQQVNFDATGSTSAGNDTLSYSWDFGDGSSAGTGATPTHMYTKAGKYTVALTASDSSSSATILTTVVADTPPTCTGVSNITVVNNASVSVPLACVDPDTGDTISRSITTAPTHGSLGTIAGGTVLYTPTAGYAGSDTFSFKGTDSYGRASAPVTATVTVTEAPPVQTTPPNGSGGGGGNNQAPSQQPSDPAPPTAPVVPVGTVPPTPALISVANLGIGAHRFTAKSGSFLTWLLSTPAQTNFRIDRRVRGARSGGQCVAPSAHRHGSSCRRWVTVRTVTANGVAGTNRVAFNARRLAPGQYRIVAWAVNAAGAGPSRQAAFTIIRR